MEPPPIERGRKPYSAQPENYVPPSRPRDILPTQISEGADISSQVSPELIEKITRNVLQQLRSERQSGKKPD